MESFVKTNLESGVGRITLRRPKKRNALKRESIEQIEATAAHLESDPAVRVIVLEAEGSVFCAGMDLGEMQQRAQSDSGKREWQKDSEVFAKLLSTIYHARVPTIAALQGPALAGGVGLVLACDFVIASETAFIMLPEPARGITAAMVTPFLVHRIGAGAATQLLLSGEKMSAERACQLGLAYRVVPPSDLQAEVDSLTQSIMNGSPAALTITKQHVQSCGGRELDRQLEMSIGVSAQARETADAREGLAAFLEKRKPRWQPEQ